jgi:hypothetical protein
VKLAALPRRLHLREHSRLDSVQEIDGRFEYDYILLREFIVDRRLYRRLERHGRQTLNKSYGQLFISLSRAASQASTT